jgi:hypothetical protein
MRPDHGNLVTTTLVNQYIDLEYVVTNARLIFHFRHLLLRVAPNRLFCKSKAGPGLWS